MTVALSDLFSYGKPILFPLPSMAMMVCGVVVLSAFRAWRRTQYGY